jgi:hypothetical protein
MVLAAVLAFALIPIACGGDDGDDGNGQSSGSVCEQACKKLEDCSPGTVCQINGSCDGSNQKIAQCIVDKPCDQTQSCFFGGP